MTQYVTEYQNSLNPLDVRLSFSRRAKEPWRIDYHGESYYGQTAGELMFFAYRRGWIDLEEAKHYGDLLDRIHKKRNGQK